MSFSTLMRAPLSIGLALLAIAGTCLGKKRRAQNANAYAPADNGDGDAPARAAELTRLAHHLLIAGELEKARIARDLHDGLGSTLTAVNLDLFWIQQRLPEHPAVVNRLTRAREVLASTVEMKRRIMHDLHPTALDTLGLGAALESHAADYSLSNAIPVETELPDELPPLTTGASIALFRICQEALANAARHAKATSVRICLREENAGVVLEVFDNGAYQELNTEGGVPHELSVLTMRERASAVGGTLTIGRGASGHGTAIKVNLPAVDVAPAPVDR
jgi:signal transduction histidine kinase